MNTFASGKFPTIVDIFNELDLVPEDTPKEIALRKDIKTILEKNVADASERNEIEYLITGCEVEMCSAGFEQGFRFALSLIMNGGNK